MSKNSVASSWIFKAVIILVAAVLASSVMILSGCAPSVGSAPSSDVKEMQTSDDVAMTPEQKLDQAVSDKVESMSLKEKLCQMIIAYPEDVSGSQLSFTSEGVEHMREYPFGGICYFSENISDPDVLESNILAAQDASAKSGAKIPLFISVDEEGGGLAYPGAQAKAGGKSGVSRLAKKELPETTQLYPMFYYRSQGTDTAYDNAQVIARYLREYGFNWDYAPVADVNSNPDNPVIGYRAYSDNFSECADLVASAVEGYESENMATTLKHFPGHGDTDTDTHDGSVYVDKDYYQIKSQELLPFIAGIQAGADSVMMGHIIVPAVDDVPASMSHEWIETILRGDLHFNGVVVTDGLKMGAVADHHTNAEIAVKCVSAGNDVLLLPQDPYGAVDALVEAVASGEISEDRIDESVTRILYMKARHGIWDPDADGTDAVR